MALWMEAGTEAAGESEEADMLGIAAIKIDSARELKEEGNQYVKKGKKHYADAIDCYTRAINQKCLSDTENSTLFANRAHVNLLMGNFRHTLTDAEEAIRLSPSNVKAYYRAAKAALSLNLLDEAKSFCQKGLEQVPSSEELIKLLSQVDARKREEEMKKTRVTRAIADAKNIVTAIEDRHLNFGKAIYQELTGLKKPALDESSNLHWPVVLLYPEVMSSDLIEDFCETDKISSQLDIMFSPSSPALQWDVDHKYTRGAIELYYQSCSGTLLTKAETYKYLLAGTLDSSSLEDASLEDMDGASQRMGHVDGLTGNTSCKWIKVDETRTLLDVLQQKDYVIPAIPVFFVVSKKSDFYKEFKAGNWSLP